MGQSGDGRTEEEKLAVSTDSERLLQFKNHLLDSALFHVCSAISILISTWSTLPPNKEVCVCSRFYQVLGAGDRGGVYIIVTKVTLNWTLFLKSFCRSTTGDFLLVSLFTMVLPSHKPFYNFFFLWFPSFSFLLMLYIPDCFQKHQNYLSIFWIPIYCAKSILDTY